jgi:predicted phosphoribosyltransferase
VLLVPYTRSAVLVFVGQSEAQYRISREVLCRWVRGEQDERSRVKNMAREERMYVGERICTVHILDSGVGRAVFVALAPCGRKFRRRLWKKFPRRSCEYES